MQFIVIQSPKHKFRDVYSSVVMIVEAASASEAKRKARADKPEEFGAHPDFKAMTAEPLTAGTVYLF